MFEQDGKQPLFDRRPTVPAGESKRWDLPLDEAGIYLITATLDGGASATYEWALDDPAAAAARTVYADVEGGDVGFTDFFTFERDRCDCSPVAADPVSAVCRNDSQRSL